MKQADKITIFQMTLLIMTAVGLKNHVIVIPPLLRTGGRDAWIAVLFVGVLTLIWGFLLIYIYKEIKGKHINDWLKENTGKAFAIIFRFTFGFYLVILMIVTMRETITWTNVSYLWRTPPLALTLLFLIPCMLAALTRINTIAIANFFLLALVNVLGFFVATANIPRKNPELLLPILENGFTPVFKSMIYQASGMTELIIFLLFQHQLKSDLKYRHIVINTFILIGLTLGPLIGAIIEFGPVEASYQRFPAYEEWALVRVGKFVEHVDYLSIYQWLTGAFIRITLLLYTIRILINSKSKKVNLWSLIFILGIVTIAIVYPIDDKLFVYFLIHFALPTSAVFFSIASFILGVLVFIVKRRKKKVSQNEGTRA